jgi:rhodanese-related sulfurtransferase
MSKRYKSKKILVKTEYKFLAALMVLMAAGLFFLPEKITNEGVNPKEFVLNSMKSDKFLSTDELASRMINQDPNLLLIDVRPESEYNSFTLPNSVNVPLEKLLDEDYVSYIDQDAYDVVLFSNDNYASNQAWMIANRLGFKSIYVLKGGLYEWFNTIINPKEPKETDPKLAFEQYNKRKATGMYFGVGAPKSETKDKPVKKVITVKKKKKRVAEGGC